MVAFTPLHTFLLCFSHGSATPRLGCCSELNFLLLCFDKWEAAKEAAPTLYSVHCVCQYSQGAGSGDPCQEKWAMRCPVSLWEMLPAPACPAGGSLPHSGAGGVEETSYTVLIVAWFNLRMYFHSHLWFSFISPNLCLLRLTNQTNCS